MTFIPAAECSSYRGCEKTFVIPKPHVNFVPRSGRALLYRKRVKGQEGWWKRNWAYLFSGTGRDGTGGDDPGKCAYLISGMAGTITEIPTCLNPGTDVAPPSKRWKCASAKQVLKLGAM